MHMREPGLSAGRVLCGQPVRRHRAAAALRALGRACARAQGGRVLPAAEHRPEAEAEDDGLRPQPREAGALLLGPAAGAGDGLFLLRAAGAGVRAQVQGGVSDCVTYRDDAALAAEADDRVVGARAAGGRVDDDEDLLVFDEREGLRAIIEGSTSQAQPKLTASTPPPPQGAQA